MAESRYQGQASTDVLNSGTNSGDRCYCHTCRIEVNPVVPEFLCPHCNKGFIEILCDYQLNNDSDSDGSDDDEDFNIFEFPSPSRNPASDASSSSSSGTRRHRFPPIIHHINPRNNRRRLSGDRQAALAPLIQDLIMQMTTGVFEGGDYRIFPGAGALEIPMLISSNLASNPGDYAWGRGGLDAIITQLMNQLDSTGPPPLSQDNIDKIPTVKITKDQCDINLQCSVCMEDFQLDEPVKQLNCEHCYHNACINPWLELHGTCPVCRKSLIDGYPHGTGGSGSQLPTYLSARGREDSSSGSGSSRNRSTDSTHEAESRASTSDDPVFMVDEDLD